MVFEGKIEKELSPSREERFEKKYAEGADFLMLSPEEKRELTELEIKRAELSIKYQETLAIERKRIDDKIMEQIIELPQSKHRSPKEFMRDVEERREIFADKEKFAEVYRKISKQVVEEEGYSDLEISQKLWEKFQLSDEEYKRLNMLEVENNSARSPLSLDKAKRLAQLRVKLGNHIGSRHERQEKFSPEELTEFESLMEEMKSIQKLPLTYVEIEEFARLKVGLEERGKLTDQEEKRYIGLGKKLQLSTKSAAL